MRKLSLVGNCSRSLSIAVLAAGVSLAAAAHGSTVSRTVSGGSHPTGKFTTTAQTYTVVANAAGGWEFRGSHGLSAPAGWDKSTGANSSGTRSGRFERSSGDNEANTFVLSIYGDIYPVGPGEGPPPPTDYSVTGVGNGGKYIVTPTEVTLCACASKQAVYTSWGEDASGVYRKVDSNWSVAGDGELPQLAGGDGTPQASFTAGGPGEFSVNAYATDGDGDGKAKLLVLRLDRIEGPNGKLSKRETAASSIAGWETSETIYATPNTEVELELQFEPEGVAVPEEFANYIDWSSTKGLLMVEYPGKLRASIESLSTSSDIPVTATCGSRQRVIFARIGYPKVHSVTFRNNITIRRDRGAPYDGVAWRDDNLDGKSNLENANADASKPYHPVAYASSDKLAATAVFKPYFEDDGGNLMAVEYDVLAPTRQLRISVKAGNSTSQWSEPVNLAIHGANNVEAANKFTMDKRVVYDGAARVRWDTGFGKSQGDLKWDNTSNSEHELYLTYDAKPASAFETVLHIGCTKANGKTDLNSIIAAGWSVFDNLGIHRKGDNQQIVYDGGGGARGMHPFLSGAIGNCVDFAELQRLIVHSLVNGHGMERTSVRYASGSMIMKKWDIPGSVNSDDWTPWSLGDEKQHDPPQGLPYHGRSVPDAAWFQFHEIVKKGQTRYDSTYGLAFNNGDAEYEDGVIQALCKHVVIVIDEELHSIPAEIKLKKTSISECAYPGPSYYP